MSQPACIFSQGPPEPQGKHEQARQVEQASMQSKNDKMKFNEWFCSSKRLEKND